jgi:hypothetical protein
MNVVEFLIDAFEKKRFRIDELEDFTVNFEDWVLFNQIPRELVQLESSLNRFTDHVSTVTIDEFIKISNAVVHSTPNIKILQSLFQVLSGKNSTQDVKTHRLIRALKSRREQFENSEPESSMLKQFFHCLNKCTK